MLEGKKRTDDPGSTGNQKPERVLGKHHGEIIDVHCFSDWFW